MIPELVSNETLITASVDVGLNRSSVNALPAVVDPPAKYHLVGGHSSAGEHKRRCHITGRQPGPRVDGSRRHGRDTDRTDGGRTRRARTGGATPRPRRHP